MTDMQTPVVAPPAWDSIPTELAQRQQWLVWKYEWDAKRTAWLKMPYYPAGGRRAGDQGTDRDRMRLGVLDVVRRVYDHGGWSGVGFAFLPGDGLIGIDIDKQYDPVTGQMSDRCRGIVEAFNTFTEVSPSGKGLHLYVLGHTTTAKSNDIGVEMFCDKQYFTVTGNHLANTPRTVNQAPEGALRRMHATIAEAKEARQQPAPAPKQPAAPPAGGDAQGQDDFRRVNEEAMAALQAWVPSLFASAIPKGPGYRVTSKSLGRDLQEDLSIRPDGIVDWGVADMGDARQGKRTPIDLVMEWLPASKPRDALHWLAQRVGVQLSEPPTRQPQKSTGAAPAGEGQGAGGGDGGGDDEPGDVYAHLVKHRGRPLDCRENVMYCLQLDPVLKGMVRLNDFTHLLERSRTTPWGHPVGEWCEEDDLMLGEYLLRNYRLGIKAASTLRNGVMMAARSAKYNPVLELIHAEKWDGIQRLEHWLTDVYEIEERPYTRLIGKCFIMGLVKRALQPGCKFDYMLIIKGEQGLKKSTAFRALAYPFFTDNAIRMGDKDSLMAMQLVWIAESAELESLNKSETTQIKQFLSAQEDMFRPPYGSQLIRAKRHSVNVGTTNADTFLKDATGDRRFWPLEVQVVNEDTLANQRLQLFAEALHRLEAGERFWPTREEERELVFPEQEPFKRTDTWEDIIDAYVNRETHDKSDDPLQPVNATRDFFPTTEIYEKALLIKADRMDGAGNMDTRIGNAMRALNFDRHREPKGKRRRGFLRRPLPTPPAAPQNAPVAPIGAFVPHSVSEDDDLPL